MPESKSGHPCCSSVWRLLEFGPCRSTCVRRLFTITADQKESHMSRRVDSFARSIAFAMGLLVDSLSARATTISDDFNDQHNYQLGSTFGTVWTGMHNIPIIVGTGRFEATHGTLLVEDNGANVGWDNTKSTSPLLYHTVPAGQDFTATVKIASQTSGE